MAERLDGILSDLAEAMGDPPGVSRSRELLSDAFDLVEEAKERLDEDDE